MGRTPWLGRGHGTLAAGAAGQAPVVLLAQGLQRWLACICKGLAHLRVLRGTGDVLVSAQDCLL
jgi:hypothetical protein